MSYHNKKHYEANKQYYYEKNRRKYAEMKVWLRTLKESKPCMDCGLYFPWYVIDFDHVRGEKVADISILMQRRSWAKLRVELEKCDPVCSNCHRVRTFTRLNVAEVEYAQRS